MVPLSLPASRPPMLPRLLGMNLSGFIAFRAGRSLEAPSKAATGKRDNVSVRMRVSLAYVLSSFWVAMFNDILARRASNASRRPRWRYSPCIPHGMQQRVRAQRSALRSGATDEGNTTRNHRVPSQSIKQPTSYYHTNWVREHI